MMTEPFEIRHEDDCPLDGRPGLCECPMPDIEWEVATPQLLSEVFALKPVKPQ